MSKKWVDGVILDMTAEEQTQFDADVTRTTQIETDLETAEENKATLKASAKAKLIAGEELTEDEANILTGV